MSADAPCPACDSIGGHPGIEVDGTARLIPCDLCGGRCEVPAHVAADWLADRLQARMDRTRAKLRAAR